ncbi:DUF1266 domain-containing protein [Corynebacterium crudilactis]|uniref:DUF1266 domain-containing protein n=1 Tax=Corynebacterium crudilactis TaxID=1652495 RepID=A0A172QT65_9CORY|nr:DUF1266 domain-containing protein [Corynebacterium crudilactis]ANE03899.1 hypothetical protein ccrud_06515 [Corynebacterium crudilactis]
MSSEQSVFIIVLFGAVILFSIVVISAAFRTRKRRATARAQGMANPHNPISNVPWRRFAGALGAIYARSEWHKSRGAKRVYTAEQTYFGCVSAFSLGMVRNMLRTDWGVKNSAQAVAQLTKSMESISMVAAATWRGSGVSPDQVEEIGTELVKEGLAKEHFLHFHMLLQHVDPSAEYDVDVLAFDIARVANFVRWAGYADYLIPAEARWFQDQLGIAAAVSFESWEEYGEGYVRGLKKNFRGGNKPYISAEQWLNTEADSPWKTQKWISG